MIGRERFRARRCAVGLPAVCALLASLAGAAAHAGSCTVPGTHPSVQSAVSDASCSSIALAAQGFAGNVIVGRSLSLAGAPGGGSIVQGAVTVTGGAAVALGDLRIESGGGAQSLLVTGGARVTTQRVEVVRDPTFPWLFTDGFESGDSSAWSATAN